MNEPRHRAAQLIEKVIPGIRVARTYQRGWLRADLIAGVTVFTMLVSQGMAYGELGAERIYPTVRVAVQAFLERERDLAGERQQLVLLTEREILKVEDVGKHSL